MDLDATHTPRPPRSAPAASSGGRTLWRMAIRNISRRHLLLAAGQPRSAQRCTTQIHSLRYSRCPLTSRLLVFSSNLLFPSATHSPTVCRLLHNDDNLVETVDYLHFSVVGRFTRPLILDSGLEPFRVDLGHSHPTSYCLDPPCDFILRLNAGVDCEIFSPSLSTSEW